MLGHSSRQGSSQATGRAGRARSPGAEGSGAPLHVSHTARGHTAWGHTARGHTAPTRPGDTRHPHTRHPHGPGTHGPHNSATRAFIPNLHRHCRKKLSGSHTSVDTLPTEIPRCRLGKGLLGSGSLSCTKHFIFFFRKEILARQCLAATLR